MNNLWYIKELAGDIMTVIMWISILCNPKFECVKTDSPTIVKIASFSVFAFFLINSIFIIFRLWTNG
jgi:hypothetical protein